MYVISLNIAGFEKRVIAIPGTGGVKSSTNLFNNLKKGFRVHVIFDGDKHEFERVVEVFEVPEA